MTEARNAPDATVYRLSLYHCYLGELLRVGAPDRITSRQLAEQLNIKEETVRRDISFVGDIGRPGSGYDPETLFEAFTGFLGLSDEYPIAKVGTAQMLEALDVVFPPNRYGVKPVAYYSELPDDVGKTVGDIEVHHLTDIPKLDPELGVSVALVACSPGWVQITLDLLASAGISGVLLLTPSVKVNAPEGLELTHVRMPCDIKSLACRCRIPAVR
jgi:redox-sensing transcriptional repressor